MTPQQSELIANLLSGLIGALVGALVVWITTTSAQNRDFDRRSRGAARAIYQELRGNTVKIRVAIDGAPFDPLDSRVYETLLPDIAFWLSSEELALVSVAYTAAPAYQRANEARASVATTGLASDSASEKSLRSLLRITRTARDTLRDRAWSADEVRRMKVRGEEEKAKLELDV